MSYKHKTSGNRVGLPLILWPFMCMMNPYIVKMTSYKE